MNKIRRSESTPNYSKVKGYETVEIKNVTIQGEGKEGQGNAAEQFRVETLDIPVSDIKEITKEEYHRLEKM